MRQDKYPAQVSVLQEPSGNMEHPEDLRESRQREVKQLRLLWDNREFLLRCVGWGFLFSLMAVLLIRSRYQATTQLMPPDNQSGAGAALLSAVTGRANIGALSGLAGDLLGAKNSGALFVGVLSSRTVQDRLIQDFNLRRVYGHSKLEDLRVDLTKHTDVSEDRKSGIITIRVTDNDPKRAAGMATAYVDELDRLVAQVSTSSARRERMFLEGRLRSVKQDLDTASRNFSDFASKNTAIDIPAQGRAMVEAAARLQGELIVAESGLRGLEAIYTDENVRVRAMRARVAELRAQLEKLGGDSNISADPLSQDSNPMYPSIRKLPILGVTYADLYRRTKIQETVFELLTQQYELAKVQEAKEIPTVKVLDAAVVPTKKAFPPRLLLTLVGTAAALLSGCLWLFAHQSWDGMAPEDPGKEFITEVRSTLHSGIRRMSRAATDPLQRVFRMRSKGTMAVSSEGGTDASQESTKDLEIQKLSSAAGKGTD